MKNYLFLHYGPGANCDIERAWISEKYSNVEFWDQPKCDNFGALRDAVVEKIRKFSADQKTVSIVAHSFGCDLALAALSKLDSLKAELIFISPIFSAWLAFANLAKVAANQTDVPAGFRDEVLDLVSKLESNPSIATFWPVIGKVAGYANFPRLYWASDTKFSKYILALGASRPADMGMWQVVLNDYLSNYKLALPKNISSLKIFLGEHDPYLNLKSEKTLWTKSYPFADVKTVPDSGHYLHLESDRFNFLN